MPKRLSAAETEALAADIRAVLADPDARLSESARHRWEGALAALEALAGRTSTLPVDTPERFLL